VSALVRPFSVPGSPPPFRVVRADGSSVYDAAGRRYISAAGGLWNMMLGWNHPRVLSAMQAQLGKMAYSSLFEDTHSLAEQLAEKLVAMSDGMMSYAYLSTTGSSAVEVAIRTSRLYHRVSGRPDRRTVLSYDLGYHGCSSIAVGASGLMQADVVRWEGAVPDVEFIPAPVDEVASLEAIAMVLAARAGSVAAVLAEPVLGSGGIIVPSRAYGVALSDLCRRYGVLLIADEVATGGGRCGAIYASPLVGLRPDILCLSKGLSAGYFPLGATLFSKTVMTPLAQSGIPIQYGSTQDGNPVGCVAALTALEVLEESRLPERATRLGHEIRDELRPLIGPYVRDIRGLGLMIGIALSHANGTAYTEQESAEVRGLCREEGLLVYHFDGGISLFPPLTISDDDKADMVDMLTSVLSRLC